MKVVGITGRSGCGKSSVTKFLAGQGYPCIDADLIAREILLPGSPCIAQLQEKFGADIADENGNVRRRLLADRAFATPAGTRALTAITQPEILHRIETRLQEAEQGGAELAFVDGAAFVPVTASRPKWPAAAWTRRRPSKRCAPLLPMRSSTTAPPNSWQKKCTPFYSSCERRNMAKKAKSRCPGLLRTLLAVLVVLALAATLLFTVFRRQVDTMEYPCRYNEYVEYYAGKYNIDPLILYSFIRTESNFNPNAQSNVGARGLMQITEETFDWIKLKIAPSEDLTFDDLYDPETNIRFGTYFVSYCLLRYHDDLATAAAAYHSGWGTVDNLLAQAEYSSDGETLDHYPYPQMRLYVRKITNSYQRYQDIYNDK